MNLVLAITSAWLLAADPAVFSARTVDGRQLRGVLSAWSGEALTLDSGESRQTVPLSELTELAAAAAGEPAGGDGAIRVALVDGSMVAASSFAIGAESATLHALGSRQFELPAAAVEHVRFRPIAPALEKQWQAILRTETDQDMLVLGKENALDYLRGVVRTVDDETIEFELENEILPVKRDKVAAIRFYRPARPAAGAVLARLHDAEGSLWAVHSASLSGGRLHCQTPAGLALDLALESIRRIEFAAENLVYLSDLEPHSHTWTPYFGMAAEMPALATFFRPRRNTTLYSAPIVLDGVEHRHGLALHSRTEITYRLGEPFSRLQALAGIDDRLRPRGNVHLEIFGDGRVLFAGDVLGTEPARQIEADLAGVVELKILVDFGADLDIGDHLILAEAKLLK